MNRFQLCDILVSFDIDGTLEFGDPAGPLDRHFVHAVCAGAFRVGSASDRTEREQKHIWTLMGIEPAFTIQKYRLGHIRETHVCKRYIHIGDTLVDQHFAETGGFEFLYAKDVPHIDALLLRA